MVDSNPLSNLMSDIGRSKMNTALLWSILVVMVGGIWQAGRVYNRLESIEREIARVRPIEEEIIKIKAHLKMSSSQTADTISTLANQ